MEQRRLVISEGYSEIEGSLSIDVVLEDGRKLYGFWFRSAVTRKYKLQVCLSETEIYTYIFRSLTDMIYAFNSRQILKLNHEGDVIL